MITLPQLCHVSGQVVEDSPGVWAEISAKQSMRALVAIPVSDASSRGTERQPLPPKRHALPVVTSQLHAVMVVRRMR
jgi:hypothetical protein